MSPPPPTFTPAECLLSVPLLSLPSLPPSLPPAAPALEHRKQKLPIGATSQRCWCGPPSLTRAVCPVPSKRRVAQPAPPPLAGERSGTLDSIDSPLLHQAWQTALPLPSSRVWTPGPVSAGPRIPPAPPHTLPSYGVEHRPGAAGRALHPIPSPPSACGTLTLRQQDPASPSPPSTGVEHRPGVAGRALLSRRRHLQTIALLRNP